MSKYNTASLITHLRAKWSNRPCPMCVVGNWEIEESIYQLMQFNDGNLVIGGPIIPLIPVTCKNCGNTILINALIAKVLEPPKPTEGVEQ